MFSEKLKTAMNQRRVSQSELSKVTGIGKSSISQYVSGKNTPSPKNIKIIAEALECSVEFLTTATDEAALPEAVAIKNISVEEAASRMGKSRQFVRVALQQGVAPFGFAAKISAHRWSYHISPMQFENYISCQPPEKGVDGPLKNGGCSVTHGRI